MFFFEAGKREMMRGRRTAAKSKIQRPKVAVALWTLVKVGLGMTATRQSRDQAAFYAFYEHAR